MVTYIATNTRNGKFYIGSTSNFSKRKNDHLCSTLNYPFQNSLRKNPHHFIWETFVDDSEESTLEQALLDMWFGTECCYNLNPVASRPPQNPLACSKGGNSAKDKKVGIHSLEWLNSEECLSQRRKNGRKSFSEGKGTFSLSPEEKLRIGRKQGEKLLESQRGLFDPEYLNSSQKREDSRKGGLTQGHRHKENCTGVFDPKYLNSDKKKLDSSKGGSKGMTSLNEQRWKCTLTGHISNPGNLTRYQKNRGINTCNRTRIS